MAWLRGCGCCPSFLGCCAGSVLAWLITSLLLLAYVHTQSSICPDGAAVTPTPVLQASPSWGQRHGSRVAAGAAGAAAAGSVAADRSMEDYQIELYRQDDEEEGSAGGDLATSAEEVGEGATVHGWLTTAKVSAGVGSTLKVLYCPSGGQSLAHLEELGALEEIADALATVAADANLESRAARNRGGGRARTAWERGCAATGGEAQGWRTGSAIGRLELLAIEYSVDSSPIASAVQAARWLRSQNRTTDPTTGLLVLGQGVVGSAAAVAAAADTRPYRRGGPTDARLGRAAVLIDAAPSLKTLYSELFPLVGGVLGWAYGSESYELVSEELDANGGGGGALGALLLPRPPGPAPVRDSAVCPGARLLVVSYGNRESSVVPPHLAEEGFRDGQWQLADLSAQGRRTLPKAAAVTVPVGGGSGRAAAAAAAARG
jgi:hypothetical protein